MPLPTSGESLDMMTNAISGAIWIPYKYIQQYMALTSAEKDVIAILSSHRNKATGLAAPGLALLVERTGRSKSAISKALRHLREMNAIKYHGGGNRELNTQWHLFGPGTDGPCQEPDCGKRRHTGGRKPKEKVVTKDDNLSGDNGCHLDDNL